MFSHWSVTDVFLERWVTSLNGKRSAVRPDAELICWMSSLILYLRPLYWCLHRVTLEHWFYEDNNGNISLHVDNTSGDGAADKGLKCLLCLLAGIISLCFEKTPSAIASWRVSRSNPTMQSRVGTLSIKITCPFFHLEFPMICKIMLYSVEMEMWDSENSWQWRPAMYNSTFSSINWNPTYNV